MAGHVARAVEGEPFHLETWLSHQRRDEYWRHGSIAEDFGAVEVPALVIAGWADGYRNTPMKAVEGLADRAKAVIGPWVHKYPHFAAPEPRLDFHAEAIRWWDRWLKGVENGAETLPAMRAYIPRGGSARALSCARSRPVGRRKERGPRQTSAR
jgi:predicted acyl esterase